MATEPTQLILDGKAEYLEDGDTVLIAVYVMDPTLEMGFPGYVKSGTCSLLYRGTEIRRITFDRRFGNGEGSDGDFIFQFNHPAANRDLQVKLEVTTIPVEGFSEHTLKKTLPVSRADSTYIPMAPQLDTGSDTNGEVRSQQHVSEEV